MMGQNSQKRLKLMLSWGTILGIALFPQFLRLEVIAAEPEKPKPNPLEISVQDPLIPSINRQLTPFEIRRLKEALNQLNLDAKSQLDQGKEDQAFEIWYREIRLRRKLGQLDEIQTLGRVGKVAWDKKRNQDVQIITKRLKDIQKEDETQKKLTPQLLQAFAQAYDQVNDIDNSLNIYLKILANARQAKNPLAEENALKTIGQLYLDKFDYVNAAIVYEELLDRAEAKQNTFDQGIYLQKLAEIYTQALQPENSIKIKERLAENHLKNKKIELIPSLKISIATDYEAIKQPEKASQTYQEAFSLAWALQQFGASAEALSKLGNLYQSHNQDDYALKIYQELLKVEQKSYDYYGLMNTYDRIGQIYLKNQQYAPALVAFQQGLTIAKSLSYQQDYFQQQIQQVNEKIKSQK